MSEEVRALSWSVAGFVLGVFTLGIAVAPGQINFSGDNPVVLYQDESAFNQSIGFYSPEAGQGIVCDTNRMDEVQISRSTFKYVNSTSCEVVEGDLTERWDDPGFEDVKVFERGQELLENQTSG